MTKTLSYVLITPARNEAAFIELTLKSVVAQTVPPKKWVIVNDGSTDNTEKLVRKYAADYPWIDLIQMPERRASRRSAVRRHRQPGCRRLVRTGLFCLSYGALRGKPQVGCCWHGVSGRK